MEVSNYSVSGEDAVTATTRTKKSISSQIEKIAPLSYVSDGQYVILVNGEGGYDLLGGKGIIAYDDVDTAIEASQTFCREIANLTGEKATTILEIGIYFVQKGLDEYGVVTNELIKCADCGE